MARGALVPDEIVMKLVLKAIRTTRACRRRGWLLDGFPRTAAQVHALLDAGLVPHHVIVLNATNTTIVSRALARAEKAVARGAAPRKDDNAETMRQRIVTYERNRDATLAALMEYLRIGTIDGEGPANSVGQAIHKVLRHSLATSAVAKKADVADETTQDEGKHAVD
mmetsp:Transcript_1479/g.4180  ORF Transcript_1479/g.4180 Transcript_1479/m.4180 type:complete len:167 (-) Transcript_1479:365-865(-)